MDLCQVHHEQSNFPMHTAIRWMRASDLVRYGFDAAICYRRSGQHEHATVIFTDLVQKHPDFTPLFIGVVNIQRQKDRSAKGTS